MIAFTLLAVFMAGSHGFILGFMCKQILGDIHWREASSKMDKLSFLWIAVFNLIGTIAWTYAAVAQLFIV